MEYPKLRPVEAFLTESSGQKLVCLRDPLSFADKMVFLPQQAVFVASLFDGMHSLLDIQAEFMRQFDTLLPKEQIDSLIADLDEYYYLESERFDQYRRRVEEDYKASSKRKAAMAGMSYELDPEVLRKDIDGFFLDASGPGLVPFMTTAIVDGARSTSLRGAVVPHIDFRRGGWCYAWAYKEIAESTDADLFLIFGTAHAPMENYFALTRKDYETPFGVAETDQHFIDDVVASCKEPNILFDDEFSHRAEHSIEFQVVFLQYLFGNRRKFKIVPVLCGSLHKMILSGNSPFADVAFSEQISAFKRAIDLTTVREQKICIIAGADLAHVGPRFGDPTPTDSVFLQQLGSEDRNLLEYVEKGDGESFFATIERVKDRRRICGTSPIYAMLHCIKPARGKLLKYGQRTDDGSTVTFAALSLY